MGLTTITVCVRIDSAPIEEAVKNASRYMVEADMDCVKMEGGLCKGKKLYDKREAGAKRGAEREIERASRNSERY